MDKSFIIWLDRKFTYYARTSRPSGWMITSLFLLLGMWYSGESYPLVATMFVLVAVIFITAAGSWVNFVFDRRLDEFSGVEMDFLKYVSQKEMFVAGMLFSSIGLILLFYVNFISFIFGVIMFFLFLFYSSPPVRLKTSPPFDSIANGLLFGPLPFFLGWSVFGKNFGYVTFQHALSILLVVISYYLLLGSLDIEKDKRFGIKTSCTMLGSIESINVSLVLYFTSLSTAIIFFGFTDIISISLIISSPLVVATRIKNDRGSLGILLSSIYFVLAESVLVLLIFYSKSIFPSFLFILVLVSLVYALCLYIQIMKEA